MKLTRNKIRKIRRQQNQTARKWKKIQHRKKINRYNTFRRSSSSLTSKPIIGFVEGTRWSHAKNKDGLMTGVARLNHVLNKTLKNYIPPQMVMNLKIDYFLDLAFLIRPNSREN